MTDRKRREKNLHKKVSQNYDKIREKDKNGRYYSINWLRNMFKMVRVKKGSRILDVGCGTGIVFEILPKQTSYVGIDLSDDMIKVGKRRYEGIDLRVMDCENLKFKDAEFDIILARSILHHVPHPKEALREMRRCLKKDGILLVSEPKKNFLTTLPRYFIKKTTNHFDEEHTHFTDKELSEMVRLTGFKTIKKEHFGFIAYPFAFPDIIKIFKFLPHPIFKIFYYIDRILSKIPLLKRLSWHITIAARR